MEFGEEFFAGGEAIIAGIGIGERIEGGDLLDGGDAQAAEPGGEGDLSWADERLIPEVDGVSFPGGAPAGEVMSIQQHASMVKRGGRRGNEKVGRNAMNLEVTVSGCVDGRSGRFSERCREVAGLFGLTEGEAGRRWETAVTLEVKPGEVVLIRGASGTGKSTLLGGVEARLRARGVSVQRLEEVALEERAAVVDCFGEPLEQALAMLSRAGLSEARLLVRSPGELSAGEAFRYRLARFMAGEARVLLADEFGAVLDRTTARVVAWQLGRFVRASAGGDRPRSAVVATSHDDLREDLHPAVVVTMGDVGCRVERV